MTAGILEEVVPLFSGKAVKVPTFEDNVNELKERLKNQDVLIHSITEENKELHAMLKNIIKPEVKPKDNN